MKMIYTNFALIGDSYLLRGYDETGKAFKKRIKPSVSVFVKDASIPVSDFTDMYGSPLSEIGFTSVREMRDFVKHYDSELYFNHRIEYGITNTYFPGELSVSPDLLKVSILDIECESEAGFPMVENPTEKVNAITMSINDDYYVFGIAPTLNVSLIELAENERVFYTACEDEYDLLEKFLSFYSANPPDILTGWNVEYFDLPYLVGRIARVMGDDHVKKLSPWGMVELTTKKNDFDAEVPWVKIVGINVVDYLATYKKFRLKRRDSYRLSSITEVEEIQQQKMTYDEYKTLKDLYTHDYDKFLRYNMQDVRAVRYLDKKLNYILLTTTLAYQAKVNYTDVLSQVRMWECIIMNELYSRNVIPKNVRKSVAGNQIVGAYVKDAQPGPDHWLVSLDLNSLYPSLIRMLNVSPETIVPGSTSNHIDIDQFIAARKPIHDGKNITAFNSCKFNKDKQGIIPYLVERMYKLRKHYKELMIEKKIEMKKRKGHMTTEQERELTNEINRYSTLQESFKVCLNSVYGATANAYFMFYDTRAAEAVTLTGQAAIKWISARLNEYMNQILKTETVDYVRYIDTDSVTLRMLPLIEQVYPNYKEIDDNTITDFLLAAFNKKIIPFIDKMYDELSSLINARENTLSLKIDTISRKVLYLTKKRYIYEVIDQEGVRMNPPEMKIMGLQAIKSSTPKAAREKLKDGIMKIFHESETECKRFADQFKTQHDQLPLEDIATPSGISDIDKWPDGSGGWKSGCPAHVKAAIVYNNTIDKLGLSSKYKKITAGDKIKYVILNKINPLRVETIAFMDYMPEEIMQAYNLKKYIDYKAMFDKNFLKPYTDMVEGAGYSMSNRGKLTSLTKRKV